MPGLSRSDPFKSILQSNSFKYFLFLAPGLFVVLMLSLVPLSSMLLTSLRNTNLTRLQQARFIGLENYINMFQDSRFLESLRRQAIMSFAGVAFQVSVSLFLAILLNKLTGALRILRGIVTLPFVIPPVVVALIWLTLLTPMISPINAFLRETGLGDPEWLTIGWRAVISIIVADTWNNFPFSAIILISALQSISHDVYESADLDGANFMQKTFFITITMIRWAIVLCIMFRLIESLKAFPLIFILTFGGPGTATEVTNFYAYLQNFQFNRVGYSSAMAFTMFIITVILSIAVGKLIKDT